MLLVEKRFGDEAARERGKLPFGCLTDTCCDWRGKYEDEVFFPLLNCATGVDGADVRPENTLFTGFEVCRDAGRGEK